MYIKVTSDVEADLSQLMLVLAEAIWDTEAATVELVIEETLPKKVSKEELRDHAYRVATGNNMLDVYDYEQFMKLENIPTGPDAWEPYEYWTESMIADQITGLAEDIISTFKYLITEESETT